MSVSAPHEHKYAYTSYVSRYEGCVRRSVCTVAKCWIDKVEILPHEFRNGNCIKCGEPKICQHDMQIVKNGVFYAQPVLGSSHKCTITVKCTRCQITTTSIPENHKYEGEACLACGFNKAGCIHNSSAYIKNGEYEWFPDIDPLLCYRKAVCSICGIEYTVVPPARHLRPCGNTVYPCCGSKVVSVDCSHSENSTLQLHDGGLKYWPTSYISPENGCEQISLCVCGLNIGSPPIPHEWTYDDKGKAKCKNCGHVSALKCRDGPHDMILVRRDKSGVCALSVECRRCEFSTYHLERQHNYVSCTCTNCGDRKPCTHQWTEGKCIDCGLVCSHTLVHKGNISCTDEPEKCVLNQECTTCHIVTATVTTHKLNESGRCESCGVLQTKTDPRFAVVDKYKTELTNHVVELFDSFKNNLK